MPLLGGKKTKKVTRKVVRKGKKGGASKSKTGSKTRSLTVKKTVKISSSGSRLAKLRKFLSSPRGRMALAGLGTGVGTAGLGLGYHFRAPISSAAKQAHLATYRRLSGTGPRPVQGSSNKHPLLRKFY